MCDECDWNDLLESISELIEDPKAEFANETLEGIQEWVFKNEHCTDGQRVAITNISNGIRR